MNTNGPHHQSPFLAMSFTEKRLIYRGLLSLVESNSGFGFCNNDQGHPTYANGRSGDYDKDRWGDSPDQNKLFRLMHILSIELSEAEQDKTSEIEHYVFCWADFCHLAYGAYERQKG